MIAHFVTAPFIISAFPLHHGDFIAIREFGTVYTFFPNFLRQFFFGNLGKAQGPKKFRLIRLGKEGLYPQRPAFNKQHFHDLSADAPPLETRRNG